MSSSTRRFILFLAADLAICVVFFLVFCDFFSKYDATAISSDPFNVNEASTATVYLIDDNDQLMTRTWSIPQIQDVELPIRPNPESKADNPDGPTVRKDRFALNYRIIRSSTRVDTIPTTTPASLAITLLVGLLLLILRNMYVAGNPLRIKPAARKKLKQLAPQGQVAKGRRVSKKGPPPSRRQKGRGRRR